MQVIAEVSRAQEAWAGLSAAQGVVKQLLVPEPTPSPRSINQGLAHVALEFSPARPAAPAGSQTPVSVVVQYLRN